MEITYDPAKNSANKAKHGLYLADAEMLDWDTVRIFSDDRRDYGEPRMRGLGYIGNRLHAVVLVERDDSCRIISLRKANNSERIAYAKAET